MKLNKLITLLFIATSTLVQAQEVKWVSIEEALAQSKVNPKPILIDLYTDWCGWCKRMDKTTYSNKEVITAINNNFYAVKFNAEQKDTVNLDGQKFGFIAQGRKGYHELAAALMNGKMSYPTTVFLDSEFNMIQPVPGYMDAKQMKPILSFLGKGHYKTTPYEEFLIEYNKEN